MELAPKRLELLHELLPAATTDRRCWSTRPIAVAETNRKTLQAAARTLGLQLHDLHASTEREFDAAFATLAPASESAALCHRYRSRSSLASSEQLVALAARHTLPDDLSNTASSSRPAA